jgi:hypothetical protein
VYGAPSLSGVDDLDAVNKRHGKVPIPLWLNGLYVTLGDVPRTISFYLVDGCMLQMDSYWCGGIGPGTAEQYPDFFPNNKAHRPERSGSRREIWEIPEVPQIIKTQHLEMLIRRHEKLSGAHVDKAAFYRRMLAKVASES